MDDIIYSELRKEIGKYTLIEIVAEKREEIMKNVTSYADKKLREVGVEVIDVRIKRADLPRENEKNVYQRMKAEREQQAAKYRFEGKAEATKIRSEADKQKTIIESIANKEAKQIRGQGDAEALQIYANAYTKDEEFYEFTRTLEAYESIILSGKGRNSIILSTDSNLWKLLEGIE